nr:MAG TPA: hypothetical protein [Bacteriophage sp.]
MVLINSIVFRDVTCVTSLFFCVIIVWKRGEIS